MKKTIVVRIFDQSSRHNGDAGYLVSRHNKYEEFVLVLLKTAGITLYFHESELQLIG